MENETWKDVVGYEGFYQISNIGNIRSLHFSEPKIMKQKFDREYKRIELRNKTIRKFYGIHRLVAMAFIPNPENKPQVNHINGNSIDNRVDNLEWCTGKENTQHAARNNLKKTFGKGPNSLSDQEVINIYITQPKVKDLVEKYKISRTHARRLRTKYYRKKINYDILSTDK